MFKHLRLLAASLTAAAILTLTTACQSVTSTGMLGTAASPDPATLHDLTGTWLADDDHVLFIKQLPSGELRVAAVTSEGEGGDFAFKLEQLGAQITVLGDRHFINLYNRRPDDAPASEPQRFTFFRLIGNAEHNLVLHPSKVPAWRSAVEANELPGEVIEGKNTLEVRLGATSAQLNAFVTDDRVTKLFDSESPVILRRLRKGP